MRNRIKYSQNFLRDSRLVEDLIRKSSICPDDIVYEIGAGEGIITQGLIKKAKRVIAFELDRNFFDKLAQKFRNEKNLELKSKDFLFCNLPNHPYKVFSNVPFNITSAIIKKLTLEGNSPSDSYLIVQKEAAGKFVGKPLDNKNSQMAVILYPWFELPVIHTFRANDFSPKPNVDIVLLEIKKRSKPLIDAQYKNKYEDFVTYAFNQFKPNITEGLSKVLRKQNIIQVARETGFFPTSKPSELSFANWLDLFSLFLKSPVNQQNLVGDSFAKQLKQQENIEKIHRTRVDKNWRKYSHVS